MMDKVGIEFRLKSKAIVWSVNGSVFGVYIAKPVSGVEVSSRSCEQNSELCFCSGGEKRKTRLPLWRISINAEAVVISMSSVDLLVIGVNVFSDVLWRSKVKRSFYNRCHNTLRYAIFAKGKVGICGNLNKMIAYGAAIVSR